MARYKKSSCETFVEEIRGNAKSAREIIMQKFDALEFHYAEEQKTFQSFYDAVMAELEDYRTKVNGYSFLDS